MLQHHSTLARISILLRYLGLHRYRFSTGCAWRVYGGCVLAYGGVGVAAEVLERTELRVGAWLRRKKQKP
ncbi:hypothetical protein V6Z12_A11G189100 [Gossypium hirsutum]